jgi:hypothetical protein
MCGAVRYEAIGRARNLCFCHCTSCRRAVGSPAVPWGTFALEKFVVVKGKLTEYRSSPKVLRGFCAQCGTSLTYFHEGRATDIDVTLVSLDDPTALKPERHIWMSDELPWMVAGDGLPQFAKYAGTGN